MTTSEAPRDARLPIFSDATSSFGPASGPSSLSEIPRPHTKEVVLQPGKWLVLDGQVGIKYSSISKGASGGRRRSVTVIYEEGRSFKVAKLGVDLSVPSPYTHTGDVQPEEINTTSHPVVVGLVGYIGRLYSFRVGEIGNNLRLTVASEKPLQAIVLPRVQPVTREYLADRINTSRRRGRR